MNTPCKPKQIAYLSLALLPLLLPALLMLEQNLQSKSLLASLFNLLFSLCLILLPLTLIRPKLYALIALPMSIMVTSEVLHINVYDGYTTVSAIASAFESNTGELTEFAHSYLPYFIICSVFSVGAIISAILLSNSIALSGRVRLVIITFCLSITGIFSLRTLLELPESPSHLADQLELYERLVLNSYPAGSLLKIFYYAHQRSKLSGYTAEKSRFRFNSTTTAATNSTHILIIGETSRAHNWSINHYHRSTTPRLEARAGVIYFSDMATMATHTRESIQLSLTRLSPKDHQMLNKEKSLISAYREAGFETIWISNQNRMSFVDTPVYAIAKESEILDFTDVDYETNSVYDEVLLPKLKKHINSADKPQLIIIHTMGSHERYNNRYPVNMAHYSPTPDGDDYNWAADGIKDKLVNSYDNSILYTDFIIDSVINTLAESGRKGTVTYFSDHGENLLDDEAMRFGHGGAVPTKFVLDVPTLIWGTENFWSEKPGLYQKLLSRKDSKNSLAGLFNTSLLLAEIVTEKKAQHSDFSEENTDRREVLNTNLKVIYYEDLFPPEEQN